MDKRTILLENTENSRLVNIIRILFGVICILLAAGWVFFNLTSARSELTIWITIVFLASFGVFQVLAGAGKTIKFITISDEMIELKQHSVFPAVKIPADELASIEIHPLSIIFFLKKGDRHILRFGITYTESIVPVKEAVIEYASVKSIGIEDREDELNEE